MEPAGLAWRHHAAHGEFITVIPTCKHLDYALGYIGLNLFAEAADELNRIAAVDRATPPVITVRLELAMAEEHWDDVIALAPRLVQAAPSNERFWIAWAYALREQQKINEARDVLLRGVAIISAPSVLVDYNLACYFCLLGDLAEARRRLSLVFTREPAWKQEARHDPDLAALHGTSVR